MDLFSINNFNELQNSLNLGLIKLEKYKFPTSYSFAVGRLHVASWNNEVIIDIDENISKEYLTMWYSSIGKLFVHDLKIKNLDNYYTVKYNNVYYLFRLITDDDKSFIKRKNIKNINDLNIGKCEYSLVSASYNERFMTSDFATIYKTVSHDEIDEIDEIDEHEYESIELFNDDMFENEWGD